MTCVFKLRAIKNLNLNLNLNSCISGIKQMTQKILHIVSFAFSSLFCFVLFVCLFGFFFFCLVCSEGDVGNRKGL